MNKLMQRKIIIYWIFQNWVNFNSSRLKEVTLRLLHYKTDK